jgi:hypothetical protein
MLNLDHIDVTLALMKHKDSILRAFSQRPDLKLNPITYYDNVLRQVFPNQPQITLEEVLIADPVKLYALKKEFTKSPNKGLLTKNGKTTGQTKATQTPEFLMFNKLYGLLDPKSKLEYVFKWNGKDYDGEWNRYSFFEELGVHTCPYCNRNHIQMIKNASGKSRQVGDLDHVIPKSKYPMFALSFYNLIPSCKVCNFFKNSSEKTIPNPYDTRIKISEQFRFGIKITKATFPKDINSFEIQYGVDPTVRKNPADRKEIAEFLKLFGIKQQYAQHKDVAQEIIQKQFIFNPTYCDELYRLYGPALFSKGEDVERAIFGRYTKDSEMHRRPLSKFIRDIQDHLKGQPKWIVPIDPKDLDRVKNKMPKNQKQP